MTTDECVAADPQPLAEVRNTIPNYNPTPHLGDVLSAEASLANVIDSLRWQRRGLEEALTHAKISRANASCKVARANEMKAQAAKMEAEAELDLVQFRGHQQDAQIRHTEIEKLEQQRTDLEVAVDCAADAKEVVEG